MNQQTAIDVPHHITSLPELAEILIRHHGLHQGRYQLAIGFRMGVGTIPSPDGSRPLPGAIMGVENVSLVRVAPEIQNPDVVDASLVNPLTKARVAAKVAKGTRKLVTPK